MGRLVVIFARKGSQSSLLPIKELRWRSETIDLGRYKWDTVIDQMSQDRGGGYIYK